MAASCFGFIRLLADERYPGKDLGKGLISDIYKYVINF